MAAAGLVGRGETEAASTAKAKMAPAAQGVRRELAFRDVTPALPASARLAQSSSTRSFWEILQAAGQAKHTEFGVVGAAEAGEPADAPGEEGPSSIRPARRTWFDHGSAWREPNSSGSHFCKDQASGRRCLKRIESFSV